MYSQSFVLRSVSRLRQTSAPRLALDSILDSGQDLRTSVDMLSIEELEVVFSNHTITSASKEVTWLRRDVLLFTNSIGIKANELHFLYVGLALTLPLPSKTNLNLPFFPGTLPGLHSVPNVPSDIATDSKFELRNRLIGIYDKGDAGSSFETEQQIVNAVTGEVYTTTRTMEFISRQGNWGGLRGPKSPSYAPERAPDATHVVQTTENTVFFYRLNGD
ncbi:hypothetical protein N7475_002561 [Penicillium sp. IBT 31633x]|nr:hypothetical protein N7475_002561 [Penicillium sp. IBT 31633x]